MDPDRVTPIDFILIISIIVFYPVLVLYWKTLTRGCDGS